MQKSREEADEQKRQNIMNAIEIIKQANALWDEAEKLFEKSGVTICSHAARETWTKRTEVHVFRGILKLEKLFDSKTQPFLDCLGRPDYSRKKLEIGDTTLFQLGQATAHKFCFR